MHTVFFVLLVGFSRPLAWHFFVTSGANDGDFDVPYVHIGGRGTGGMLPPFFTISSFLMG